MINPKMVCGDFRIMSAQEVKEIADRANEESGSIRGVIAKINKCANNGLFIEKFVGLSKEVQDTLTGAGYKVEYWAHTEGVGNEFLVSWG